MVLKDAYFINRLAQHTPAGGTAHAAAPAAGVAPSRALGDPRGRRERPVQTNPRARLENHHAYAEKQHDSTENRCTAKGNVRIRSRSNE